VFVDCEVGTYNINPRLVEEAIGPRTRALFVPHTLGNPCDMETIAEVARRRGLWLLEDCCDALGATFNGQLAGTFGEMASLSFYPAHHITMGEGGGVAVNALGLARTVRSMRDWGRDCWCDPGKSGTCGSRFERQTGELPHGYDHKYIYSNIGYNLKVTDLQAAIGLAQTEKLGAFIEARRRNFQRLYEGLKPHEDHLILPRTDPRANPSPFGFPITVRPGVQRARLVRHLEDARIETRLLFGGNIVRQPGFLNIEKRIHGDLAESDAIMRDTFFIGVYPGLTAEMLDYVLEVFQCFFRGTSPRTSRALCAIG
jgi:CDP-6-deoxy-D-xylo-4-hexulose-3-dehydrase